MSLEKRLGEPRELNIDDLAFQLNHLTREQWEALVSGLESETRELLETALNSNLGVEHGA